MIVDSGIECDLNINNSVGIRNTHLLSAYSQCESDVLSTALYVYVYSCACLFLHIFYIVTISLVLHCTLIN